MCGSSARSMPKMLCFFMLAALHAHIQFGWDWFGERKNYFIRSQFPMQFGLGKKPAMRAPASASMHCANGATKVWSVSVEWRDFMRIKCETTQPYKMLLQVNSEQKNRERERERERMKNQHIPSVVMTKCYESIIYSRMHGREHTSHLIQNATTIMRSEFVERDVDLMGDVRLCSNLVRAPTSIMLYGSDFKMSYCY